MRSNIRCGASSMSLATIISIRVIGSSTSASPFSPGAPCPRSSDRAVAADADELLETLIVYGTPREARRRLGRWHDAGADFPVLLLGPNLSPDERTLTLKAFRPMLPDRAHS